MTRGGIRELTTRYERPAKLGLSRVGAVALAWILANPDGRGADAYSYWYWNPADPYREAFGNVMRATRSVTPRPSACCWSRGSPSHFLRSSGHGPP